MANKNDKDLVADLFKLWQNLAEAGELRIGNNFSDKYNELNHRGNKYKNGK